MRTLFLWMLCTILLLCQSSLTGQDWSPVDPQHIGVSGRRDIVPQTYYTYHIDDVALKSLLWSAPHEYLTSPAQSNTIIRVGLADGSADLFRIVQYDMMEAPLAAKYPGIKTFKGVSISNPYRRIRADWTKRGFRAVISDLEGKTFIDHFQRNDMATRIVYYANEYTRASDWACNVMEEGFHDEDELESRQVGDCLFRSYRLAVATTGEYSNFFDAFSPAQSDLVHAEVVTAVNRVNDVYEADFTVRLILIGNNDDVYYYDPAGDPYTNNDGGEMLSENQETLDAEIGSSNYDIGHVFSTGGGGVAFLGAICNDAVKAWGVTGSPNPVGDPYIIDYVAHEMGHQFGGSHTFNGTAGNCGGTNRSPQSAYEPGSGSTIMAYAGICGSQNIQPHSDDYMHARSLLQITNKIGSSSCHSIISFTNEPPVAANVPNYTIPVSTPFVLTADVTDVDDDPLTYCWEQYDLETTSTEPPSATDTDGPMFRTFPPVSIPERYFPRLEDLTQNITPTWEVLPSVSRSMVFKMTVRDYHEIAGCTDEDNVTVTTNSIAGPFVVTSQNSATTWVEGSDQTITWNVANTTASPINCSQVDIFLSLDGGMTYPVTLATGEANDGSAIISVPAGTTMSGRVMVKASGNVFFDINNTNITIEVGLPNYTLMLNPSSVSECNDGTVETIVEVGQFMGFSDPVTLTMLNVPPGATAVFDPPAVTPGNSSVLTVSGMIGLIGVYTPVVKASSTTGIKEETFTIQLFEPPTMAPDLMSPANNSTDAYITPFLEWESLPGVPEYEYQIAFDVDFSIIAQSGVVFGNTFQVTSPLAVDQQYYWRVQGNNTCEEDLWSSTYTFTTIGCFLLMSTDVPVAMPAGGAPVVSSTINAFAQMDIADVDIVNLTGTHSWVDDLKFTLISPDGTEQLIWDQPCGNHDNFDINFDDEAPNSNWPCPPTNGGTFQPDGSLSIFDGGQSSGVWTLEVQDVYIDLDGGQLNSWGLKVCGDILCELMVTKLGQSGLGSLPAAINCASDGDTIFLASILSGDTIDVGAFPLLISKDITLLAQAPDIYITSSGSRVFEIGIGADVEMVGLRLIAGIAESGAAIHNPGVLTLEDVVIDRNPGISGASLILNTGSGELFVEGDCVIQQ